MSAQPVNSAPPDQINIEVDGKAMQVAKGSMIIQATDAAKIAVPRFCYHEKLSIAANCRMCLVDVEKSPKPVPACATPVMEGMKIFTRSARALSAQRNVMEFLLINHPLDCPICDQGGECELQDVAMGYGRSVSRFSERKRVVADEDIGPLIATDMTRCIHCTRCVRFMSEIAGTTELGGMGRGEDLEIGTYIGKSIESELGGNIIDVCPVGALTNKPFRYRARAWELTARASIGYHDALGSNLFLHTRRGEVLRTVPRDNESINESWISDRDRYSHQGLYSEDRATHPMVRGKGGALQQVSWEEAIAATAQGLRDAVATHGAAQLAALVHPATTCEEGALLAEIVRGLGSENIDHRLRMIDPMLAPVDNVFEMPLAEIEHANAILLIGSNPRLEQPLLGHRVHKAWKRGGTIYAINPVDFDFNFVTGDTWTVDPWVMVEVLAGVAKASMSSGVEYQRGPLLDLIQAAQSNVRLQKLAESLRDAGRKLVVLGDIANQHPAAATLRSLARFLAKCTGAALNELPSGANGLGLSSVGVVPRVGSGGLCAVEMLSAPRKALIVYGAEVANDFAYAPAVNAALMASTFTVAFSPFITDAIRARAHVILPIGLLPEIDGTLVNVDGLAQQIHSGAKLPGDARPGWRVLRALGASFEFSEFAFTEFSELLPRLSAIGKLNPNPVSVLSSSRRPLGSGLIRVATVPIYSVDAVVRRSEALQATPLAATACVGLNPADAARLGLGSGDAVRVTDGQVDVELPLAVDASVAIGSAWIPSALEATQSLLPTGSLISVGQV
ncbi:MAG: NADH-quinone oxidoreductase subunit NuoG [Pseudomonadota bacterium]|nr:NADH-quinone oxidoreductase subunit NuoG [Pseudomonadota bacterium]